MLENIKEENEECFQLLELPEDVIVMILEYCDVIDVVRWDKKKYLQSEIEIFILLDVSWHPRDSVISFKISAFIEECWIENVDKRA